MLLSLLAVACLSFFIMKAFPGSPFSEDANFHPLVQEQLRSYYKLDQPVLQQLAAFLGRLAKGDLGFSLVHPGQKVSEIIIQGIPTTVTLGIVAVLISVISSFAIVFFCWRRPQWKGFFDFLTVVILSIPTLLAAPMLILIFAIKLDWLPVALAKDWTGFILPTIVLSLRPTVNLARLLTQSLEKTSQELHVRFTRSLGFSENFIFQKNILRCSLSSFLAYLGPTCAGLLSGSFLVESIFALPGLGYGYVASLVDRDYPVVIGLSLFYCLILMTSNLLLEFIHCLADSRWQGRHDKN